MKTIRITTHWSAEQADGIYRLLDELKNAVWQNYGDEITEMYREIGNQQKSDNDNGSDELEIF